MFINSPTTDKVNKCNIILFGPSGSGKSSFIKSIYRALYNNSVLPNEVVKRLVIKEKYHNEGTIYFTQLRLVEENKYNSGIILCDTRGHFKMNEDEKEQFRLLLSGKVKDGVEIQQRTERNPLALWEFWKKDSELFPLEIFRAEEAGIESIPHEVVFVFDGSTDEVIQKEDEAFYKKLVNISRKKGYDKIHVVLTRIDIIEKYMISAGQNLNDVEKNIQINRIKDSKIEKIVNVLGINRSNVHFIENYHGDMKENSLEIDHSILKILYEILNDAELFAVYYLNKTETCLANCFGI